MSIGKVLGGTVIATPAVGGGGYVIYKEVTKEETTASLPTEQEAKASDNETSGGPQIPIPETDKAKVLPQGESSQQGKPANSGPLAGENRQEPETEGGGGAGVSKPPASDVNVA